MLYIGKARDLRARLSSYRRAGGDGRLSIRFLEQDAEHVETITLLAATYTRALGAAGGLVSRAYYTAFRDHLSEEVQFPRGSFFDETAIISESWYVGMNDVLNDGVWRTGVTTDLSYAWGRHSVVAGAEAFYEGMREFAIEVRPINEGMPITIRKVEDVGRQKIVRASLEGREIAAIIGEDDSIPVDPKVAFDPAGINLYANSWRVETGA